MRLPTRVMIGAIAAGFCLALAGCAGTKDVGYQGWVEADLVFVSQIGRASCRERV